jgi:hypothetical protein
MKLLGKISNVTFVSAEEAKFIMTYILLGMIQKWTCVERFLLYLTIRASQPTAHGGLKFMSAVRRTS